MVTVEGSAEAAADEVIADAALALIENNRLMRRVYRLALLVAVLLSVCAMAAVTVAVVVVDEFGWPFGF